jgi:hypothetical protein
MTSLHKPLFSPPLQLVEAYLAYPLAGPHELAKLTGLTLGEVVEGLAKRDLPMSPLFDRELLHDPAT